MISKTGKKSSIVNANTSFQQNSLLTRGQTLQCHVKNVSLKMLPSEPLPLFFVQVSTIHFQSCFFRIGVKSIYFNDLFDIFGVKSIIWQILAPLTTSDKSVLSNISDAFCGIWSFNTMRSITMIMTWKIHNVW